MKTHYDLKVNSAGFQEREGLYAVVTRINVVHLDRLMKYNSDTVDVSDRDDQN